jgi:hypothetical protein
MIVYRVHETSLCHESINGPDMIAMVPADIATDLLAALKAICHDGFMHWDSDIKTQTLAAIAKAEGR